MIPFIIIIVFAIVVRVLLLFWKEVEFFFMFCFPQLNYFGKEGPPQVTRQLNVHMYFR